MPSTVADSRDHSMSDTLPSPISSTPSSTLASARNCSAAYSTPVQRPSLASWSIVVLPCASCSVASSWMSPSTGSGAGPPNMPECIGLPSASRVMSMLVMPRSVVVSVGTPTAKLPVSTTRIVSARSSSAFSGTNASRPPVPCSSEPSQISLTPHGKLAAGLAQRAQRREVHDDVALAVGGPAPVPAPVPLGELEHRRRPRRPRPAAAARRSGSTGAPSACPRPRRGRARTSSRPA